MKIRQKIWFVLLLTTFSNVYGDTCTKYQDFDDCLLKAKQVDISVYSAIGWHYYKGTKVLQNYKEAFKWYRKAVFLRPSPISALSVGHMFLTGKGVSQNPRTGFKWIKAAADTGYLDAQYLLGLTYSSGQGTLQNYVMAHMYFNLASIASLGTDKSRKEAIEFRNTITRQMTPSQIAEAQKLAESWRVDYQQFDKFIELESKKPISFD